MQYTTPEGEQVAYGTVPFNPFTTNNSAGVVRMPTEEEVAENELSKAYNVSGPLPKLGASVKKEETSQVTTPQVNATEAAKSQNEADKDVNQVKDTATNNARAASTENQIETRDGNQTAEESIDTRNEAQQQAAATTQEAQKASKNRGQAGYYNWFNGLLATPAYRQQSKEIKQSREAILNDPNLTDEQKQEALRNKAAEIAEKYKNEDVRSTTERVGDAYQNVKGALAPALGALKDAAATGLGTAMGNAFNNKFGQDEQAAGSANRERKANISDEQAAANMVTAQQNQQIANRNEFAEADKKDMAKAGAAASKAVNQLGAEAGSGTAALAGAKAAASTGGPDIGAEQARQDQARGAAAEARNVGFENKRTAETIREANAAINDNLRRVNERNRQSDSLSSAYQGMDSFIGKIGDAATGILGGIGNAFKRRGQGDVTTQREQDTQRVTPADKAGMTANENVNGSNAGVNANQSRSPLEIDETKVGEGENTASTPSASVTAQATGTGVEGQAAATETPENAADTTGTAGTAGGTPKEVDVGNDNAKIAAVTDEQLADPNLKYFFNHSKKGKTYVTKGLRDWARNFINQGA